MNCKSLAVAGCVMVSGFVTIAAEPPAAYRQVDWIESSAAQRIDTGIVAGPTTSVYCAFRETTVKANRAVFGGVQGQKNTYAFFVDASNILHFEGNANTFSKPKTSDDLVFETDAVAGTATLTVNGVAGDSVTVPLENTTGATLNLFAFNTGKNASWTRMSSFRVWQQEDGKKVLVCDLVPVVCIETGVAGMYDVVRNVFLPDCSGSTKPFAVPLGFAIDAIPAQVLDGKSACEPLPVVRDAATGKVLAKDADYTLSYSANTDYGVGSVRVTGVPGTDYAGMWTDVSFGVVHSFGGLIAYYVKPDGTADADCSDWDHAGTLAKACTLAADAASPLAPNVILLKSGTVANPAVYDYSAVTEPAHSIASLTGKKNILVHSEDGNPTNCIIRGGGLAQNRRCLEVSAETKVEGITFERFAHNGTYASGAKTGYGFGGALFALTGTEVSRCIFRYNYGEISVAQAGDYYNCLFICNTNNLVNGYHIGGICAFARYVKDCEFVGNNSKGGALELQNTDGYFADHCTFVSNYGASACWSYNGKTIVTNSLFFGNQCMAQQSGLSYCCKYIENRYDGGDTSDCQHAAGVEMVTVYDGYFKDNAATSATLGAAAHAKSSKCYRCVFEGGERSSYRNSAIFGGANNATGLQFYNCTFRNAIWDANAFYRGATLSGCVISNITVLAAVGFGSYNGKMMNCIFNDIKADSGLFSFNSAARICNSLFTCISSASTTATAMIEGGTLVNCTLANNVCGTAESGAFAYGYGTSQTANTLQNCIVYGNTPLDLVSNNKYKTSATATAYGTLTGTLTGGENFPLEHSPFASYRDEAHPYGLMLKKSSGLIDKGMDVGFTADDVDLAGLGRINGAAIDPGCYEWYPRNCGLMILLR